MIYGHTRPPAVQEQKISVSAKLHNRFDVEVIDAKTGELKQKAVGYNVICDALWNCLFSSPSSTTPYIYPYFQYILFGSGAGTPAASDTALFSLLGSKRLNTPGYSGESFVRVFRRGQSMGYTQDSITLQAEEYVGSTITEVGIGYDATHIVTHAMLQDMEGNPISITKTDTDVIKIYATVYLHWTAGGAYGGMLNLAGSRGNDTSSLLARLTGANTGFDSAYWLFGIERTSRSGTDYGTNSPTINLSTTVSRAQRKVTATGRIAAAERNTPIRYMQIVGAVVRNFTPSHLDFYLAMGSWYTPPAITAEAVGTGDGTKQDFSTAFPVKTAGTVYVDGVAAPGVTVRPGPANGAALHCWLMLFYTVASGNPYLWDGNSISFFDNERRMSLTVLHNNQNFPFYNPFAAVGIAKVDFWNYRYSDYAATWQVDMSADGSTWIAAGSVTYAQSTRAETTKTVTIPAELRHLPYMRIRLDDYGGGDSQNGIYYCSVFAPGENLNGNIHFDTPPAAGAVITADYTPDCIAKDSNHVFDLTLELTLGEYTEA